MSTCYVNCDKVGYIEEKVYDIDRDSEEIINNLVKMSPEEQEKNIANILGDFPNTYTFTKSMAERTLKKRRPVNMPVVLLRPSIIGGSFRDPFPGWTDTLSAAGGLGLAGGVGVMDMICADPERKLDIVPVDMVVHATLVSTAFQMNEPGFKVV
jgi:hypothetical protein